MMKRQKSSSFCFFMITCALILLQGCDFRTSAISFPGSNKIIKFFAFQPPLELRSCGIVFVEGVPKSFISSDVSLASEHKQFWLKGLKEFMRGFNEPFPFDRLFSEEMWKDYSEEEKKYGGKRDYPYRIQVVISIENNPFRIPISLRIDLLSEAAPLIDNVSALKIVQIGPSVV